MYTPLCGGAGSGGSISHYFDLGLLMPKDSKEKIYFWKIYFPNNELCE